MREKSMTEGTKGESKRKTISTRRIGDGKLPNKYWVSISDDFLYESEPGTFDWNSDRDKKETHGKTIAVFSTYKKAREFFDAIDMGEWRDGILVNNKTIEDRLSGELTNETMQEIMRIELSPSSYEDLSFTQQTMSGKGVSFE